MSPPKCAHVDVVCEGRKQALSPFGGVMPFRTEHGEGSVFMVHQPASGFEDCCAHSSRLSKYGTSNRFEIQCQCRFKVPAHGTMWLTAELRDGPMKLTLVTRALCKVLLSYIQKQAAKRGSELRYSFGDADSYPSISVPALACDRVVMSEKHLTLPVDTPEDKGCWRDDGNGDLVPMDRAALKLDTQHYFTFIFSTSHLDWNEWAAVNVPGVGQLDLEQFWGKQGLYVTFCDDGGSGANRRRSFAEMHISSRVGDCVLPPASAPEQKAPTSIDCETEVLQCEEVEEISPVDAPQDILVGKEGREFINFDDPESGDEMLFYEDGELYGDSSSEPDEVAQLDAQGPPSGLRKGLILPTEDISAALAEVVNTPITVPWYFIRRHYSSSARGSELFWCLSLGGRLCWRHHSQVEGLCNALGYIGIQVRPTSSVQELEHFRRGCQAILSRSTNAPGLLHEFTKAETSLSSLQKDPRPSGHGTQVVQANIVEAEGRISQRVLHYFAGNVFWYAGSGSSSVPLKERKGKLSLQGLQMELTVVADTPAVKLMLPSKEMIVVCKSGASADEFKQTLQAWSNQRSTSDSALEKESHESVVSHRESVKGHWVNATASARAVASRVRTKARAKFLDGGSSAGELPTRLRDRGARIAKRAATMPSLTASAAKSLVVPSLKPAWLKDPLGRWPNSHVVLNDIVLCLEPSPQSALALSADLLRVLIKAQDAPAKFRDAAYLSIALKCADLAPLSSEELWGFWVNVFHCLRIHAAIVLGLPKTFQQTVAFFNSCSYVVAGHAFTLVEMEHCILRHNMTKPRVRFSSAVLKIWRRSDEDLEMRPSLRAPPCPASCFKCQADWRLNLVLNPGLIGFSEKIPIFEPGSPGEIEDAIQAASDRAMTATGSVSAQSRSIELPYNLHRYRDDAPGSPLVLPEKRWAMALSQCGAEAARWKITYAGAHSWALRNRLDLM